MPPTRLPAKIPRNYDFNVVVGLDGVKMPLHYKADTQWCLNMVCWGTTFQLVVPPDRELGQTGHAALDVFFSHWVRWAGAPSLLIVDLGPEFVSDHFCARCQRIGTMVHFTDSDSPWEAARTESKGGKFKMAVAKVAFIVVIMNSVEFLLVLCEVAAAQHELANCGGHSPAQLVFGRNPRLPPALTDVPLGREGDSHENAFKRSCEIREAARVGWMQGRS